MEGIEDEKPYFHGLSVKDIQKLIILAFDRRRYGEIDRDNCTIRTLKVFTDGKYVMKLVCEVNFKRGTDWQMTINHHGFVAIENFFGVMFPTSRPVEIADLISEKFIDYMEEEPELQAKIDQLWSEFKITDSKEWFVRWLKTPQYKFSGERPIDLLITDQGYQQVWTLMGQIEHGILA